MSQLKKESDILIALMRLANKCILIMILLLVGLLAIIAIWYIYKRVKHQISNYMNKGRYSHSHNPTVVVFKTHVWNDGLEKFAQKLWLETVPKGIDFFILMHSDNISLPDKIVNDKLKRCVLVFAEADINKIYPAGFYSMWLSNHWILMWFYRQFNQYQYYWSVEYDVRISGNSYKIWSWAGTEDFVYPVQPFQDANWRWKNNYVGGRLTDETKWYGYLQLARYSNRFMAWMDKHFAAGENGQDEMIVFSLYKRGETEAGFSGNHSMLAGLIRDSWSVANSDSDKHKKILDESEAKYRFDANQLMILHPVKQ